MLYLRSVDVRLPFSCGGISNDWLLLMDTQLGSGGLDLWDWSLKLSLIQHRQQFTPCIMDYTVRVGFRCRTSVEEWWHHTRIISPSTNLFLSNLGSFSLGQCIWHSGSLLYLSTRIYFLVNQLLNQDSLSEIKNLFYRSVMAKMDSSIKISFKHRFTKQKSTN